MFSEQRIARLRYHLDRKMDQTSDFPDFAIVLASTWQAFYLPDPLGYCVR